MQAVLDARAPGLLYLVAVLSDDVLAAQADVWVWAAAPGPARPDHLRLDLGRQAEIDRLQQELHRTLHLRRAWLGALAISTDAGPHPVIADLTPGGPLQAAGAQLGEEILAIAGVPVATGADVDQRLLAAESGEPVDVAVRSPAGARTLRVTLGSSPLIFSQPPSGMLDAVAFTDLRLQAERARPEELWVIRLNQALTLLRGRDFEGAVRLLRDLKAPQRDHGVGQATIDYWLGLALAGAGPGYREAAADAFARAAQVSGARLMHDDGPWVAPRAEARLLALRGGS